MKKKTKRFFVVAVAVMAVGFVGLASFLLAVQFTAADAPTVSELLPGWQARQTAAGDPLAPGVLWRIGRQRPWHISHQLVTYSADAKRIYVVADERLELRDAATLDLIAESPHVGGTGHSVRQHDCVFVSPDGGHVFFVTLVAAGYVVRLIDPDTLAVRHEFEPLGRGFNPGASGFLADGRLRIACSGRIGQSADKSHMRIYDPEGLKEEHLAVAFQIHRTVFSPDARHIAGIEEGQLTITDFATGEVVTCELPPLATNEDLPRWRAAIPTYADVPADRLLRILNSSSRGLAWLPDGKQLLVWGGEQYLRLDASTGEVLDRIASDGITSCGEIHVHPSGKWALAGVKRHGDTGSFVDALDLTTGRRVNRQRLNLGMLSRVTFLPEETFHIGKSRLLYSYPSLRTVPPAPAMDSRNSLRLSDDGTRIVTRGIREHQWDLRTGALLASHELPPHLESGHWRLAVGDDLELENGTDVSRPKDQRQYLQLKNSADDSEVSRWYMPGHIDDRIVSPSGRYIGVLALGKTGTGDNATYHMVAMLIDRQKPDDPFLWRRQLDSDDEPTLLWLADDARGILAQVGGDYVWWPQDDGKRHVVVKLPRNAQVDTINSDALNWHPDRQWVEIPDVDSKPGKGRYFIVDLTGKSKPKRVTVDIGENQDMSVVAVSADRRLALVSVWGLRKTWLWLCDAESGEVICRFPDEYSIITSYDVLFTADRRHLLIDTEGVLTCYDLAAILKGAGR